MMLDSGECIGKNATNELPSPAHDTVPGASEEEKLGSHGEPLAPGTGGGGRPDGALTQQHSTQNNAEDEGPGAQKADHVEAQAAYEEHFGDAAGSEEWEEPAVFGLPAVNAVSRLARRSNAENQLAPTGSDTQTGLPQRAALHSAAVRDRPASSSRGLLVMPSEDGSLAYAPEHTSGPTTTTAPRPPQPAPALRQQGPTTTVTVPSDHAVRTASGLTCYATIPDAVHAAVLKLGGVATLRQLYKVIDSHNELQIVPHAKDRTQRRYFTDSACWKAQVRHTLYSKPDVFIRCADDAETWTLCTPDPPKEVSMVGVSKPVRLTPAQTRMANRSLARGATLQDIYASHAESGGEYGAVRYVSEPQPSIRQAPYTISQQPRVVVRQPAGGFSSGSVGVQLADGSIAYTSQLGGSLVTDQGHQVVVIDPSQANVIRQMVTGPGGQQLQLQLGGSDARQQQQQVRVLPNGMLAVVQGEGDGLIASQQQQQPPQQQQQRQRFQATTVTQAELESLIRQRQQQQDQQQQQSLSAAIANVSRAMQQQQPRPLQLQLQGGQGQLQGQLLSNQQPSVSGPEATITLPINSDGTVDIGGQHVRLQLVQGGGGGGGGGAVSLRDSSPVIINASAASRQQQQQQQRISIVQAPQMQAQAQVQAQARSQVQVQVLQDGRLALHTVPAGGGVQVQGQGQGSAGALSAASLASLAMQQQVGQQLQQQAAAQAQAQLLQLGNNPSASTSRGLIRIQAQGAAAGQQAPPQQHVQAQGGSVQQQQQQIVIDPSALQGLQPGQKVWSPELNAFIRIV